MSKHYGDKGLKSKVDYPDIMTINQVAEYFQISEVTTYKLVQEGSIPAFKIGRHWRVKRDDLDEFIERLKRGERI
ncbi:helix-turn-helix domain-containing protein [Phosphitispora fastidiosa]|uniref:helix-turn-helix domain-containing protein n=1 Tax=Phosphitispora fastidiosa TaxID=2837202 RepID=UPI001E4D99F5|nr:helix-turn-helix domain-containing protein [Phosphitispora fastidiosa]MBU7008053.1 excisionase family DNA binding protein [Phosphitispora fastidiosa]